MKGVEKNKKSVEVLWNTFLDKNPENKNKKTPISFYLFDNEFDANECADLVVKEIKKSDSNFIMVV